MCQKYIFEDFLSDFQRFLAEGNHLYVAPTHVITWNEEHAYA